MPVWASALVVVVLVLLSGLFVAAEIALVSLREGQVRAIGEHGHRGERVTELVGNPNRFLRAVQIGVTTTAILVSACAEAPLGHPTGGARERAVRSKSAADVCGFVLVVLALSYVTILLGELVP